MKRNRPEISVDVDGVLLDTMFTFCNIYNEIYETSKEFKRRSKEDVTCWEFNKEWKLADASLWYIFDLVAEQLLFVPLIDPISSNVMRKMKKTFIVDVVTARKEEEREALVRKLNRHRIVEDIQYDALHIVDRHDFKAKLNMPYNIYIDDSPNIVEDISKYKDKLLLLFDQPWNRHCKDYKNVIRVHNWREVWKVIVLLKKRWKLN